MSVVYRWSSVTPKESRPKMRKLEFKPADLGRIEVVFLKIFNFGKICKEIR